MKKFLKHFHKDGKDFFYLYHSGATIAVVLMSMKFGFSFFFTLPSLLILGLHLQQTLLFYQDRID